MTAGKVTLVDVRPASGHAGARPRRDLAPFRRLRPRTSSTPGLTNDSGWVPVDRTTFATRFPGVFAVGDVTTVPLAMGRPLPKAGVFAHQAGEVVADNLIQA